MKLKCKFFPSCFFLFFLFSLPFFSLAEGFQPVWKNISGAVFVVDKSQQKIFIYDGEKRKAVQDFVCTTGREKGDKRVEGDLRTPEGVYFVEASVEGGLDFELYGGQALVLNFPNLVDRAEKKTGYGIWVHGRGREIVPRDTQGCVALENIDLQALKARVELSQTPVFISSSLSNEKAGCSEEELDVLLKKTAAWAQSWAAKQDDFFGYYDESRYNAASRHPFSHFRAHKRALFARYAWIDVFLSDARAICSDTYAVTYFGQLFQAPRHNFEGVKRLYWQKDKAGEWKIVGEEWRKGDLGLKKKYRQQREPKLRDWIEAWRGAWEQGNLDTYRESYLDSAEQGRRKGIAAIVENKKQLWKKAAPVSVQLEKVKIRDTPEGVVVRAIQTFSDASGYRDYGMKELLLYPAGPDSWKIAREDWKKL